MTFYLSEALSERFKLENLSKKKDRCYEFPEKEKKTRYRKIPLFHPVNPCSASVCLGLEACVDSHSNFAVLRF